MAAVVVDVYQSTLNAVIALALFMPVVLALGESVSVQSVTLMLQRLHGAPRGSRTVLASLGRELATAALLGLAVGALVGSVAWAWQRQPAVAAVIAFTVTAAMTSAALIGAALPAALRGLRRDPRIASGPIALALADLVTLQVYFGLAGTLIPSL